MATAAQDVRVTDVQTIDPDRYYTFTASFRYGTDEWSIRRMVLRRDAAGAWRVHPPSMRPTRGGHGWLGYVEFPNGTWLAAIRDAALDAIA